MGEGTKAQARVKLGQAARLLTEALGILQEVKSEEGKAILSALKSLQPVTPDVDEGVSRNEIKSLMAGADGVLPGPGAMRPGPGAGGGPGGPPNPMFQGLGPMPPRPFAVAGQPFGGDAGLPGLV